MGVCVCVCVCVCVLCVLDSLGFFPDLFNLPRLLVKVQAIVTNFPRYLVQDGRKSQLTKMQPSLSAPKVCLAEEERRRGEMGAGKGAGISRDINR